MRKLVERFVATVLAAVLVLGAVPQVALGQALPEFPVEVRVLIEDEATGEVLWEQGADERAYPASLTKMMTALVAFDSVGDRLDEQVTVGDEVLLTPAESTVMGLAEGDVFTWRDLLYGMLVPSGGDAALVIATHVGRSVAGDESLPAEGAIGVFVDLMNRKADEMGLAGTHFANVHGFHDDDHYSCARELLVIARAVRENELLRTITGTSAYACTSADGRELEVFNTNWLIDETCGGIDEYGFLEDEGEPGVANPYYRAACTGVKTGYTGEAGRCLAFSCEGGITAVGVVLGFEDQPTIYGTMGVAVDALASSYERRTWTATEGEQELRISNAALFDRLRGDETLVAAASDVASNTVDATSTYVEQVVWDPTYVVVGEDGSAELATVVGEGTQVATVQIMRDGEIMREVPLLAARAMTPWGNRDVATIVVAAVAVLAVVLVLALSVGGRKRRQRRREAERRAAQNARRREERERQAALRTVVRGTDGSGGTREGRQPQRRKPSHMRQ